MLKCNAEGEVDGKEMEKGMLLARELWIEVQVVGLKETIVYGEYI